MIFCRPFIITVVFIKLWKHLITAFNYIKKKKKEKYRTVCGAHSLEYGMTTVFPNGKSKENSITSPGIEPLHCLEILHTGDIAI